MPLLQQTKPVDTKADLRSSFDSYNSYRGEIEQARSDARRQFETDIIAEKARMSAKGLRPGSKSWNRTIATLDNNLTDRMNDLDAKMENFKKSFAFRDLYADYEKKVLAGTNAQSYTEKMLAIDMRGSVLVPTFDEYVDLQYGSEAQQQAVKEVLAMRRQNEVRLNK